jgi:hypothetical protein
MEYEHSQQMAGEFSNSLMHINESVSEIKNEMTRPFVLLKPRMFPDGNMWCALYGENLQEGVAGFGDTPEKAAIAFDFEWRNRKFDNSNPHDQTIRPK